MAYVDVEAPRQYQALGEDSAFVKTASREVRMGFVRKVYGILTAQLLLTVAIAAPLQRMSMEWLRSHVWLMQASLLLTIVFVVIMSCCPDSGKRFPTNYLLLVSFTICEAICVGMISACYTAGVVALCAGVTSVIFLCMTVYAWTSKTDFTGFGPYLLGGAIALFVFGTAITLLPWMFPASLPVTTKIYAGVGVLLFTLYIVYDTQLIIGEFAGHAHSFSVDEYVFAALNLYLDIVNLFIDLLSVLGDNRN